MSKQFEVSGGWVTYGVYEAESEQAAKDLVCREMGYKDEADMETQLEQKSTLIAEEISE